jgi:hypothetical protein
MPDVDPKFDPGELSATPGATALGIDLLPYLARHLAGDWGEVDPDVARANELAVESGESGASILSGYQTEKGSILISTLLANSTVFLLLEELPGEQ